MIPILIPILIPMTYDENPILIPMTYDDIPILLFVYEAIVELIGKSPYACSFM